MKMTRKLAFILVLALLFTLSMPAMAVAEDTRTVTFYTDSTLTTVFTTQIVPVKGQAVKPSTDPAPYTKSGYRYEFENWYWKVEGVSQTFDFSKKIRNDTTIYAGYTQYLAEGFRMVIYYNGGAAFSTDTATPVSVILNQYPSRTSVVVEAYEEGSGTSHTHNYDYANPVWSWAENYMSASLAINCLNAPTHTETVKATVKTQTTPASCTETGATVYTATATFDGKTFTDTKTVEIPKTAHTPEYKSVEWDTNKDNVYGAYFTYVCSACGEETEDFVPGTYKDFKGERTYTATDSNGNIATSEPEKLYYTVIFDGVEQSVTYAWSDTCLLTYTDEGNSELRAWYLKSDGKELLVADGVSSYNFSVTKNTEIVTKPTQNTEPQAAVAVTLVSETSGTAVFDAMWSIPSNAEVKSAIIYRGSSTAEKTVDADTLIQKGAPFDTELLVRKGSYRLNLVNLTPSKYQHVVIQITYTLEGETETHTLTSEVLRVQANGGVK